MHSKRSLAARLRKFNKISNRVEVFETLMVIDMVHCGRKMFFRNKINNHEKA